jgi:RNA polymerase sigma factor (sigma-70 family)
MATRLAQTNWRAMDTLVSVGTLTGLTDRELLGRFLDEPGVAGEDAFRALVARHGPMVLAFCRSMLKDPHAAEDAFQATFLVLVRKARSIWIRDSVGPWLYAVAGRVARRARRRSLHRHELDLSTIAEIPGPDGSASEWPETYQGIHEEIIRLPATLRGPIVLCCLEGLSYDAAAIRLGLTEPALRGRLHRARKRLASRLRERGLTEPALMVAAEPFRLTSASLPPALVESTVRFSMRWASINVLLGTATDIPDSVTALARAVIRAMLLPAAKQALLVGVLLVCILGTAVVAQQRTEVTRLETQHEKAAYILGGENPGAEPDSQRIERVLPGTWECVSSPKDPKEISHIKHLTPTHYTWVTYDSARRAIIAISGGTWSFRNGKYEEICEFASETHPHLRGKAYTYAIDLVGDKWDIKVDSDEIAADQVFHRVKLREDQKKNAGDPGRKLFGTWEKNLGPVAPKAVRMLKHITPTHWTWVIYDRENKMVLAAMGGLWSLKGDNYEETIAFTTHNSEESRGNSNAFGFQVDSDRWLIKRGPDLPGDAEEAWKRVK